MSIVTVHKTIINCACPHGRNDVYEATFETTRLIPVEIINAAIECYTIVPIYQEDLTKHLAEALQCRVTLHGTHKKFLTTATAGNP